MTSGAESTAPLMSERDLGEDTEPGARDASSAEARHTRNGARTGITASSLAESSLHDSTPSEMTARPSSMHMLIRTRRLGNPSARKANRKLRSVAQTSRIARGRSILPRYARRATRTEAETAASQMGQLMPAWAE